MKTLIISDVHGRGIWQNMVRIESPNRVIFLGDYWDSFHITFEEQLYNFKQILEYKKQHSNTILLIGNHDYHYHPYPIQSGEWYSGFQSIYANYIKELFIDYKDLFQMVYQEGEYVFTHAGIGEQWLKNNNYFESMNIVDFINDLWSYTPKVFGFKGNDPHGDSIESSPIWIRPRSLMKGNQYLKKKFIQIVGHTHQLSIDIEGKATEGRYFFTDTQDTSEEYLTIIDGELKLNKHV